MASILYKFRSGTNFEALPMPGTAARLFEVKRAIVRAKKLDRASQGTQLEFDLSVRDAATNQEYQDESMLLPRGTRLVVQRLPAAKGQGLLARIARTEAGVAQQARTAGPSAPPAGFYTINSRDRDEEDEFVDATPVPPAPAASAEADEDRELAALRAVTEQVGGGNAVGPSIARAPGASSGSLFGSQHQASGSGRAHAAYGGAGRGHHQRPNADPELRDAEQRLKQQQAPKKRATGIPRTFLSLSAPPPAESTGGDVAAGEAGGEKAPQIATLQPNAIGFEALIARGGGQSESGVGGKRKDLDYALKLTATSIPEHLECALCHSVVKNAMLIPWDPEGRTTCEVCIRDGLTQNGYRCPLTNIEGVSPDDLLPNQGLRKAAELFVKSVMEKMEEIEQQNEAEEESKAQEQESDRVPGNSMETDDDDKGVVMSRKPKTQAKTGKKSGATFGEGDDDFGGDVFDVANVTTEDDEANTDQADDVKADASGDRPDDHTDNAVNTNRIDSREDDNLDKGSSGDSTFAKPATAPSTTSDVVDTDGKDFKADNEAEMAEQPVEHNESHEEGDQKPEVNDEFGNQSNVGVDSSRKYQVPNSNPNNRNSAFLRKDAVRKRGPPAGYAVGPAGVGVPQGFAPRAMNYNQGRGPWDNSFGQSPPPPPPRGGRGRERGFVPRGGDPSLERGGYHGRAPYMGQARPPFRGGRGGRGPRYFGRNAAAHPPTQESNQEQFASEAPVNQLHGEDASGGSGQNIEDTQSSMDRQGVKRPRTEHFPSSPNLEGERGGVQRGGYGGRGPRDGRHGRFWNQGDHRMHPRGRHMDQRRQFESEQFGGRYMRGNGRNNYHHGGGRHGGRGWY